MPSQFAQRLFPASLEIRQETVRGSIVLPHKLINVKRFSYKFFVYVFVHTKSPTATKDAA